MIVFIITNVSSKSDALVLGKKLLDEQLVVCSNIGEVTSQYFWKGKYHEEKEYSISFKTTMDKKASAIKVIKQNHPYETPLIASKDLEINNSYKAWMDGILS